jgi:NurA-like 5'-3' nuclease
LTPENLQLLFEAIIREQKIITADTELLEEIAEEQDNNGILELNSENLSRIFMDEDSAKSVLNQLEEQGSEIKSNLYFIHESSYNDAYHSEVYDNVMGALEDYFGSKPEYVYPTEKGKKSYVKMKLNKINFFDYLKDYIYENRKYPQTNFDYFGSYLYLISNEDECLKAFAPDYADWSKTKKNINSFFPGYF